MEGREGKEGLLVKYMFDSISKERMRGKWKNFN